MDIKSFGLLAVAVAIFIFLAVKISQNPFWGLLLIFFFLPFERIPSFDVAGVTLKINHFIGGLTLIFWILALLYNRLKLMPNPLLGLFGTFWAAMLISLLGAGNLTRAISVFIFTTFVFAIFLLVVNLIQKKEQLGLVYKVLFVSVFITTIYGFYQFFGDLAGLPTGLDPGYVKVVFGFPRVQAFSQEPLYYGNFLLLAIGLLASFFLAKKNVVSHSKMGGLLILILVNFALTLSRGAFIGLAFTFLILAIFYFKKIFTLRNITLGILILAAAAVGVYSILSYLGPEAKEKFLGHLTLSDLRVGESTQGRLASYSLALDAWRISPIIGIGVGNYGPFSKGYPDKPEGRGWDIVNNEYIEILAETGVLGLSTFLLFLFFLFWRSIKAFLVTKDEFLKTSLIGLNAALIGVLVQYNFFSTLYIIYFWVLLGLVVANQNLILTSIQNSKVKMQK